MTVVELGLYALLLAAAALAVWRRPVVSLYLFVIGLALHNAVMAALYASGVRGTTLTVISAWKEILLAVALVRVGFSTWRARRLPFRFGLADWLAVAFGALVIVYALIPQSALDGLAGHKAVALALRHDLVPVGAYFLGRSLLLRAEDLRRLGWALLGVAAFVAGIGLIDVYAVSIGWWRTNGVIDYFHRHLGYDYHGTGVRTEPPNGAVYGLAGELHLQRRRRQAVSAQARVDVSEPARERLPVRRRVAPRFSLLGARRSRSPCSQPQACCGRSRALRSSRSPPGSSCSRPSSGVPGLVLAAVVVIGVAIGWAHLFPKIGPTGRFTQVDITYQQAIGKNGPKSFSAVSGNEPSLHSHWLALKEGVHTMIHHPQGYGLGNVGQTASRTGTPLKAGESNYTELGVELGVLGALLWTAWGLAIFAGLVRRRDARMAAAFAAILALAVQTDVIGDPWVAYCVWAFAGALLTRPQERLAAGRSAAVASA